MSKILEPFTNFLVSIGIDPLLFAIVGMSILIYRDRNKYKNWKEKHRTEKTNLRLYIVALVLMIGVWIAMKIKGENYM